MIFGNDIFKYILFIRFEALQITMIREILMNVREDDKLKPNYNCFGLSQCMGKELRKEVEQQLLKDLEKYEVYVSNLKFDWSDSCIEGHSVHYLDGYVENFSGIKLFNTKDDLIAEGWMEFIYEKSYGLFIVYWEFLDLYVGEQEISKKEKVGIPEHIYGILSQNLKEKYKKKRI